jgi:hypothetical protein
VVEGSTGGSRPIHSPRFTSAANAGLLSRRCIFRLSPDESSRCRPRLFRARVVINAHSAEQIQLAWRVANPKGESSSVPPTSLPRLTVVGVVGNCLPNEGGA